MGFEGIVFLLLGIAVFAIAARAVIFIYQYEEGVRFRYGRYLSKLPPGPNFLVPLIDVVSIVDMRIRSMEVPPQKVVTSDNAVVMIEAVIYYRPIDAEKIILHVAQYEKASVLLSQTSLRAIVGEMIFDNLNSEREYINRRLKESLDRLAESWGIMIISAEIGEVNPEAGARGKAQAGGHSRERGPQGFHDSLCRGGEIFDSNHCGRHGQGQNKRLEGRGRGNRHSRARGGWHNRHRSFVLGTQHVEDALQQQEYYVRSSV
ncbi:MAG: SPFH domain-containing protein [Candidatus Micrarchaeota archaeon]|nr:SPFH domain-containing protein [Candidatus Micrarchaeota archaeon]